MSVFDRDFLTQEEEKKEAQRKAEIAKQTLTPEEEKKNRLLRQYIGEALYEFPSVATRLGTKQKTIYLKYSQGSLFSGPGVRKPISVWEIGEEFGYISYDDNHRSTGYYIDASGTIYENRTAFTNGRRRIIPKEEAIDTIFNIIKECQDMEIKRRFIGNYALSNEPGKEKQVVQEFFLRALKGLRP